MSSVPITFDRLAYIDRLKEAGFDEKQARAQADALDAALRDTVATKADIELLRAEVRADFANLKTDLANFKTDIARWMFGAVVAIGGLVIAVEKILK